MLFKLRSLRYSLTAPELTPRAAKLTQIGKGFIPRMVPSIGAEAGGGDGEPGDRDSKRRGFVVAVVIVKKIKKENGVYIFLWHYSGKITPDM